MRAIPQNRVLKNECPDCGSDMVLRDSKYGLFYGCIKYPDCKATHGAHPNGDPLGKPADKETKEWRIKAHAVFDRLWRSRLMSRSKAYAYLAQIMKMKPEDAHIGKFTKEQCQYLIEQFKKDGK